MAYFLTDLSKEILDNNRREYGGGLNKFEPNDLNNAGVIDLDKIDSTAEQAILALYNSYRASVLRSKPDPNAIEKLGLMFSSIVS